ncbi:hypothetical protein ABPG72_007164 [Tetrahymena utriculariae]
MQVNSQSSGSQMDSVERMPGLKYRDSLEEDSYGNKSISKQSFKNTQNSSSTLNQNEIVSGGDQRLYQYEYEIYQRQNQQQAQQDHQFNHPNQGLSQLEQQHQHLEQYLQNCLGQNQQNIHHFNQIDPRRRLFVQNYQNQNMQNLIGYQMGENEEDEDEEEEQEYNQQDSAEQQQGDFDQNKKIQEQEDEEGQEVQYYEQDHTQNNQNENQEHYNQKYNSNYHPNERDDEKEYEIDNLDENGNNILGRNVLNQYLQRESNKLMTGKQNQQEEQFYDEENIQEDEQNQYIESLVTEKQDGDENETENQIFQKQQKELDDKKQYQQQQNEMHQEQNVLLYRDSLSNNQSKNQTPTNSQRSENYNSLKQEKQNEQKQSKNLDMQYQLPVQMSQQLFSTSLQRQQSNHLLQQKQDEIQKIKETFQSNQSQASSKQVQNQFAIEKIKQSPQYDNQSNSYRDSENMYNSQANSMISNQERQTQNNQIQYTDSLNSKDSFRSSQNQNENSIRYSHHSQQQQQQQQLKEQLQPLDELKEQKQDNTIKENYQVKQQVYQAYNSQNSSQNQNKEQQNYQQITPKQSVSKREDHVSNETFQVRNQSNIDENYTYRSKESLDLTKRSTLSNASATQVAQKQLYMLNLLEQKEQLNSERYNMLVQDEEIIEQDMASSHRTDIRVNSEDYWQLKQLIMSKNPSSQQYQYNEKSNLKLEDNQQFNKQLSTQSQQTPENRQKQLSSITGNNTKELFEYSNSSNKNNQTNNLFDSQPRGGKDCYDSTTKNRLKVDLFKKLTDPTMVGNQQNQPSNQNNIDLKNNKNYAQDNFENSYSLNMQQNNKSGNQQNDQLYQKSLSYQQQQQQPTNMQKDINKYDFTKKEKDEDIFKTAKEWRQNTNEQNKYFYSEISPIDKGPRYKPQYFTINNNNNSDYEELLKRQQQGSPLINNDNNTNQITFQNNFNFQSISNQKEGLDDDQSHRTPTNQYKNHINKQQDNDECSYQQQDTNQNNYQDGSQLQKTHDLPTQKNEYRYNFIERKQKLQNKQQFGQIIENEKAKSEQNQNDNSGELSYKTPQLEPVSQAILNRYLRRQQVNENQQYEFNNILDENKGLDQIHQMDHQTYNEYNIAKYQRKMANYKPDFIEKLQEYQQMSDKKKREYDELEIVEQNVLQNYIKQKSPVLRQPKENIYMPSNALMKGINLRKINQQMKNQVKKSLSNNNKQLKRSHDFSNTNISMRQVQNNSNYSLYSPQKNYLNNNSYRNDAKIRNEMIMNNLNYSPSSEIDNLNSSSNEKPNANSSYRLIKNQINKNTKQNFYDDNAKKNLSPNKQEQISNEACNQCHTCKQHLPNSMSFQNSNNQETRYKIAHTALPTFFNFQNNNQDQYQQNQLINFQISDVTSPISQIKSNTKSPIKLDSIENSPIKFCSHLNSPFDKSAENYAKSKGFVYDPYKFNGYDYRNIPKKYSGHNKSQSVNLNATSTSDVHQFNLEEVEKQCIQHIQNQQYDHAQSLLTQIESYIYQTFQQNHPQRIYINYLNARIQQGLQQSSTAVKYCERGLKEILREELFNDSYLFKYSFTLRQLAQCECKKIKQFQQQKYYLTQMEEQLNYCEKEFSNLNIEIARIYSDLQNKFGLHIYRELAKVCQELKEYQNACKYIKIIQSKMNFIDINLQMSLIEMLLHSQQKNEAIEESKKVIKFLRTVETSSVIVKEELLLQCIDNLANLYFERQEYDQSSDWFEQSLQIKTHLFGQYHQITGVGYFLCGKSHHKQNNSVKAIQRLGTCISILDKHLSLYNLYSANSYLTIAEIAKKDQKIDEAIKNYKFALERFSGIFGSDHFNCLCILLNLIYLTCNFTQSTTQVQVVFSDIVKNTENKLSLDSVQVLNEMSNILRQNNFIQQSLEGYLIASNILKQLNVNKGTKQLEDQLIEQNLFLVYMNLASTYQILQQHEKSIMAYFDALNISQTLHYSSEYQFKIHNFLAQSFKAINKYSEAQKHYQEALNIISTKEGFINEKEDLRQLIKQCKKK